MIDSLCAHLNKLISGASAHKEMTMYRRHEDPNDGIVSAEMSIWTFLSGIALSFILVFLVVGYALTK